MTSYSTTYLDRAIAGELTELRAAAGGRNNTLIKVAARLYTFVEAGVLDEAYVTDTLAGEASALGLHRDEIRTTLRSAQRRAARIDDTTRQNLREKCAGIPATERKAAPPIAPEKCEPPAHVWRAAAAGFLLWSQDYVDRALPYLTSRGLTEQTAKSAGLGFNPETRETSRAKWGLAPDAEYGDRFWLPAGIVIPSYAHGALWKLQIRRETVKDGQERYKTVTGSRNALYGADSLRPGQPAILVEGPFDAMAVRQAAGDLCGVVASGTSGARHIKWIGALALCGEVLVSLDADGPGDTASAYWLDALPNARRHRPYYSDPAQMLQDGQDLRAWVRVGLSGPQAMVFTSSIAADYWRGEVAAQSPALARLRGICEARGYSYELTIEALGSE
jgi:hypothetical protein